MAASNLDEISKSLARVSIKSGSISNRLPLEEKVDTEMSVTSESGINYVDHALLKQHALFQEMVSFSLNFQSVAIQFGLLRVS